ncbi:transposable element Tcb2 transposase [Trichonephila clavipes]|nr:transposable element Tcb2 transposase [Trichonephila clavipes]
MDPTCQLGNVQAGGGSVMVWDVCSWRYMGPLISLDTTLTGDSRVMRKATLPELLQSGSRSTFLNFETSAGHQNFHTHMNISQNIWDALQRAVQKGSSAPITPTDLWTTLQDS